MDILKGNHLVVDLETLSTKPTAAIVSIGAVIISDGEITPKTYKAYISRSSALTYGCLDLNAILFWIHQDNAVFNTAMSGVTLLPDALEALSVFIRANKIKTVWGNGADFDNVILSNAYHECKLDIPWHYSENRCLRTLRAMHPKVKSIKPLMPHDALSDAIAQAKTLIAINKESLQGS